MTHLNNDLPTVHVSDQALLLPDGLALRQAAGGDRAFMKRLFTSTRDYLRMLPLPEPQIEALIDQQYHLQQIAYAREWPDAHTLIVLSATTAIGKLILDENGTTLHVIDIAIEPAMRGKGHGTSILRSLQAVARKHMLALKLSVDRHNPLARKLYLRLGFQITVTSGTHEFMMWSPSLAAVSEGIARAISEHDKEATNGWEIFHCNYPRLKRQNSRSKDNG